MHIKNLAIKNFRALEDIHVDFDNRVNVIVGPNAIGKTTVLEAIRLVKALLSPRTQNEAIQTLFALGASSPHFPQQLEIVALARNPALPIVIGLSLEISHDEVRWLENNVESIARNITQSRLGQSFSNPAVFISYLATSQGQQALKQASSEIADALEKLNRNKRRCRVELTIDPKTGPIASDNSLWPSLIAALDQRLPPNQTVFSYFPADRALPQGEQPFQLGAADTQPQLESHNSQPQTKYGRLKSTIFSAILMSDESRNEVKVEFEQIFNGILKGRRIKGFGLNQVGFLSIQIEDIETGRVFDLDAMSSGEKGLILTYFLIQRTVAQDGLILLDEPELHLNPAVCKDLLSFMVDEYVIRKNLQVFVCSHSPEILAGAFDRQECSLYHLESERMLTKVRRQDESVINEALRRLGTSESEGLLYKGTIFVEGPDDVSMLETGFQSTLRRYKIKDLGGRNNIEKEIKLLQEAQNEGKKVSPRYFIFDRDEAPTNLTSSGTIKILQWDRRCFENYLLDIDILADLLMDKEVVKSPLRSVGEVDKLLRNLALSQLDYIAVKQIYQSYKFTNTSIESIDFKEMKEKDLVGLTGLLTQRLLDIKDEFLTVDERWGNEFLEKCKVRRRELEVSWNEDWKIECDGKKLFRDLGQKINLKHGPRKLKLRVMDEMRSNSSENWNLLQSHIENLITIAS